MPKHLERLDGSMISLLLRLAVGCQQRLILVVEHRRAPTAFRGRIVASNEHRKMSDVAPCISYERVYLLFVEPGERLLVRMRCELAPPIVRVAHAGLLSRSWRPHARPPSSQAYRNPCVPTVGAWSPLRQSSGQYEYAQIRTLDTVRHLEDTEIMNDDAPETPEIEIPAAYSAEVKIDGNRARQLLEPGWTAAISRDRAGMSVVSPTGVRYRLVTGPSQLAEGESALKIPRAARKDASLLAAAQPTWLGSSEPSLTVDVLASLKDAFSFVLADSAANIPGLRLPQLGAVHAVLGYWTTGATQPGTVVMPTGTGKTETMVALFSTARPSRLLVVVPSDALRDQLATKFESLGVLQESKVISSRALRPVVGRINHKFTTAAQARAFAERCNVLIATPAALFASDPDVSAAMLESCSHLFVDEAHHVEAATWRRIRDAFGHKPVLQFTATPYREDGRQVSGRLVYSFPLREAQRHGYFSTINYVSVIDFEHQDKAIAEKAIEQLRQDIGAGRDHLLMARVKRIGRATELCELYASLAPDMNPVVLHSTLSATSRRTALANLRSRASKIVVCVDMLGEGFDLPSLKIAAIHDPHKSLGVTLQFIGRFARVTGGGDIGDATVVVGRPERQHDDDLRKLYSEDADWNLIVRDLSEAAVGEQQEVSDFESAFGSLPEEVSLRNLEPKMSTVAYRTACRGWNPQAILDIYPEEQLLTFPIGINEQAHVAWFVTEVRTPVQWGDLRTVEEITYDLYVLYWNETQQILYINSSDNGSVHETLAKAVCGSAVSRFAGEAVYRVMGNITRLVPTNVGVLDVRNRNRRFSLHVGADVIEGFPVAEAQTKTKTNIFAYGYESGQRVSIGASVKKGRVWSYRVAPTLKHWIDWCNDVGAKLSDDGIDIDEVMRGFIRPKTVEQRPPYVVLGIEWPWEALLSTTEETRLEYLGQSWPLVDVDLAVTAFAATGPIPFCVRTPEWEAQYEAIIGQGKIVYSANDRDVEVVSRRSRRTLSEYFDQNGPTILLEQDALIVPPGILLKPDREVPPIDSGKLVTRTWPSLTKEVQGPNRDSDSIQAQAIEHIRSVATWDAVVDDHGSNEIADIVAVRIEGQDLIISLTHCKASSENAPGARIGDLYEVCGQAEKCVRWRRNVGLLFEHLIRRERRRNERNGYSGLVVGDGDTLYRLEEQARLLKTVFRVSIAQPGLSKQRISSTQMELLGATELYLYETANATIDVLCSD
jgi:superfamily II DNA or RNA helicase